MENSDPKNSAPAQMPAKKLSDVITEKAGILNTQHTSEEAGAKMRELDVCVLPVSEDRKLVGMLNEKAPQHRVAAHGHDPKTMRVGEQMSRELVFCYEYEDRSRADQLMQEKSLRYLPVVDREMRIVGIITREDLGGEAAAPASHPRPASGISG